jgi:histidine triad (HIT) family protein
MAETTRDETCLFCKIVSGQIPATVVRETERTVAFRDVNPQAPTHVLVITREHHGTVGEVADNDPDALVELVRAAKAVAEQEGLPGYRLVFNSGAAAQQTVHHVHGHVIGGRPLTWPPG